MAIFRSVQISFWQDSFVLDLTPEEKFFYIYLLTNSKTSQCGIYELPKKIVEIETGYNRDTVTKLLRKFINFGKIEYNEETHEIYIINWIKYNPSKNPNVQKCVDKELACVKCRAFVEDYEENCKRLANGLQGVTKQYARGLRTATKKEEEQQEQQEEQQETIAEATEPDTTEPVDNFEDGKPKDAGQGPEAVPYQKIKDEWNRICTGYPPVKQITRKRKVHIKARWKQFGKDMAMFTNAFGKLQSSSFCKGENDRGWTASFDWLMGDDTNMVKVLEDKYKNKESPKVQQRKPNAFHNFKQAPPEYSEKELTKILKEINNLQ